MDGKGWLPAGGLAVGNAIVTRAGPRLFVKSVKWHRRAAGYSVYNFEVEALSGKDADGRNTHSYFVGKASGGAWVHNANLTCLSGMAGQLDRAGLTKAGRAYQKHMVRPNSLYPQVSQSPRVLNPIGQDTVDDILTDPASSVVKRIHPSHGPIMDIRAGGRGARFRDTGEFMGLL